MYIARNWDVSSSSSLSLARSDSLVKQHRGHQLDGVRSESVVERSGGGGGLQRLGGEETDLGRLQRRRQIFLESDEPEFEGIRFEAFLFVSGGFSGCKREGDEPSRGVPDRVARESGRRRGKSNEGKARLSHQLKVERGGILSSLLPLLMFLLTASPARPGGQQGAMRSWRWPRRQGRRARRRGRRRYAWEEVCKGDGARARAFEKKAKKCE